MEKARMGAAGKPAAVVAAAQSASERRRNRPLSAADRQRTPASFDDPDDRPVTTQPTRCLRGDRRAAAKLTAILNAIARQRVDVDVDDDLARITVDLAGRGIGERGAGDRY